MYNMSTAPTNAAVHLGFDMGIRNLAFCLMEHTGETESTVNWKILAWDNVDLLAGGQSSQDSRRCCACAGPAAWSSVVTPATEECEAVLDLWCKACATGVRRKKTATRKPVMSVLPCATLTVKDLRKVGVERGWDKKAGKEELLRLAASDFLMPWKAPKKATKVSLALIRQKMDGWLDRMLPTFAKATLIRLENQPVMKGPTMKSIQIMLFTLLGHRLEREHGWKGRIEFVHAGTKTKGAEMRATEIEDPPGIDDGVVDAEATAEAAEDGKAYRARKKTAETETTAALEARGPTAAEWLTFFQSRSKKSDLADAFLMALRR